MSIQGVSSNLRGTLTTVKRYHNVSRFTASSLVRQVSRTTPLHPCQGVKHNWDSLIMERLPYHPDAVCMSN